MMEQRLQEILNEQFGKTLDTADSRQVYQALMLFTKEKMAALPKTTGDRKLYYVSAEFLIGKLLSNNLINLGLFEEAKDLLARHGHELTAIEEAENEPSLGNGGLGRLAACFLDSIATLGLCGDGAGLNYHDGLFYQKLENHKQKEEKNPWITPPELADRYRRAVHGAFRRVQPELHHVRHCGARLQRPVQCPASV